MTNTERELLDCLKDYIKQTETAQVQEGIWFNKVYKEAKELVKKLTIPVVVSSKNKPKRTLGDFDVWYKPCTRCGYDTAKSTKPKDGNKRCWKCGNFVQRDYTDRALKK